MNQADHTARPRDLTPAVPVAVAPVRDHALDLLRTLAILGMMAAHTARLIVPDVRPDWARFILLVEPVIPSLFLFLVGLSLAHSFGSARLRGETPGIWYGRQLKRAGGLWVISAVFFALEMGVRLPDMVLAGGILANIAYAIALTGGLIVLPVARPSPPRRAHALRITTLTGAVAAGSAVFVLLDLGGVRVHPVNIGNSPFLPLWLFAFAGALWGTLTIRARGVEAVTPAGASPALQSPPRPRWPSWVAGVAAGALAVVAIALIARSGLDALFTKPLGRSDASRLVPAPVYGGSPLAVGYYNLKPLLAITCLGLHLAALTTFGAVQRALRKGRTPRTPRTSGASAAPGAADAQNPPSRHLTGLLRSMLALGRHALTAYILHLALLAGLVVLSGERQPLKSGGQGTLVLVAVALACQATIILRRRNIKLRYEH